MKILTQDLPSGGAHYGFSEITMSPDPAPAPVKPKVDPDTKPAPTKPKVDPWRPTKPKVSPRPKA